MVAYLRDNGYTKLTVQVGTGEYAPSSLTALSSPQLPIEVIKFSHTFGDIVKRSRLIISHAGAGSILEALRMPHRPRLLVVVNTKLMDNHQLELAEALSESPPGPYLLHAQPETVVQTLVDADWTRIKPYPAPDFSLFPQILAEELESVK